MTITTLAPATHEFTLESISKNGSDRAQFEAWCEAYAYRVMDGATSYDDAIDALDGEPWTVNGERREIELPGTYSHPIFVRLRSIFGQVVRELRA